ncbi:MAG: hypothetical protein IJG85_05910 [Eubacteriaceae bacterium]|nr:hypothetical protein [Eubacteriaceae bacterium]MBR0384293.1 hypothetical protein [Eubacteriaceae bacterium]
MNAVRLKKKTVCVSTTRYRKVDFPTEITSDFGVWHIAEIVSAIRGVIPGGGTGIRFTVKVTGRGEDYLDLCWDKHNHSWNIYTADDSGDEDNKKAHILPSDTRYLN